MSDWYDDSDEFLVEDNSDYEHEMAIADYLDDLENNQ